VLRPQAKPNPLAGWVLALQVAFFVVARLAG
jgi:hypothetical protein